MPTRLVPPLHFHKTFEDSFFVLEGLLTAQLGDDVVELRPGDFATAPPGVPHSLTNAHAEQAACRAINLLTPGVGFDQYIAQIDELVAKGGRTEHCANHIVAAESLRLA